MDTAPLSLKTAAYLEMVQLPDSQVQQRLFEERNDSFNAAIFEIVGKGCATQIIEKAVHVAEKSGLTPSEIRKTLSSASNPTNVYKQHKSSPAAWQIAEQFVKANKILKTRTHQRVFTAHQKAARICTRGSIYRMAEREGCEFANNMSGNTLKKGTKYLIEQKVIECVGYDKRSGAALYRFAKFPSKARVLESEALDTTCLTMEVDSASILRSKVDTVRILREANTDAVLSGALGTTGYLVYKAMDATVPLSLKQIAWRIDMNYKTVENYLTPSKVLRSTGIVKRVEGGYIATPLTDAELDARIAAPAGTLGKRDALKQHHADERAQRATYFAIKARWKSDKEYRKALTAMYPIYQHGLDYDVVQKLIAPNTPERAVDEAIHLQATGTKITPEMVREIIQRHKDAETSLHNENPITKAEARRLIDDRYWSAKNPFLSARRKGEIDESQFRAAMAQLDLERNQQIAELAEIYV